MLITNFSAGELSEELFGRTDLGQYFQGAARIENFDIIPTGGIRKRSGSKRLYTFDYPEGGRIIPFIIDRENCYLIGLFPERGEGIPASLGVYHLSRKENGDELVEKIIAADNVPFVKTLEEINDVQYAQKFYVMILVHQNYPPVQIIYENGDFNIEVMPFTTAVRYTGDEKLAEGLAIQDDDTFFENWLRNTDNYPCTATFFQDRLILAGTRRDRQRLFVSEVGNVYSFSTYKIFLTEERNYITVKGKVENENQNKDSDTVKLTIDLNEYLKFFESISNYHIDSPFFDDDTVIVALTSMYLTLSKKPKTKPVNEDDIKNVDVVALNYETLRKKPSKIIIASKKWETPANDPRWSIYHKSTLYVCVGPNYLQLVAEYGEGSDYANAGVDISRKGTFYYDKEDVARWVIAYPEDNPDYSDKDKYGGRRTELDPTYLKSFYEKSFSSFKSSYPSLFKKCQFSGLQPQTNQHNIITQARANIEASMQFYFSSGPYWLYGPGTDIKQTVEQYKENLSQFIIPFYTKKINQTKMTTPDCGFTFEIASDMSDAIKWITFNKHLIIGTETAEWIVPASVTATNIQAVLNSRYGCDHIPGISIGDAVVFIQAGKKALVEYYLPQQDNNFRANNMTLFSKGMLHESPAQGFDFTSAPYTRIFVCRKDHSLVTLLYERSTGTFAWGRITTNSGAITHVVTLPGINGFDDVYLMVKDDSRVCLEVLRENVDVYLDSHKKTGPDTWVQDVAEYDAEKAAAVCVTKDESGKAVYETLPITVVPDWKHDGEYYIGYPYKSVMRTLPVLANNKMAKQRITSLTFRFLNSFLPKVSSIAGGRNIKTDTITNLKTPYSGVHKIAFPGTWDEDVQVDLSHDKPEPVKILSLNAEVQ